MKGELFIAWAEGGNEANCSSLWLRVGMKSELFIALAEGGNERRIVHRFG